MPTNSKKKSPKKPNSMRRFMNTVRSSIKESIHTNPHRSFRLTRRRDYVHPITLPHPIIFIMDVSKLLWVNRRVFLPLMLFYAIFYALLIGIASQDTYNQIVTTLEDAGTNIVSESGTPLEGAGLTFLSIISGNLSTNVSETQQILSGIIGLIAWLTTVWLLRNILAGNKVKMRDGLYNAGAPIVATAIVIFIILLQLLPIALAIIGYAAASGSGLIANGGVEAMLFWIAAALLGLLSLFWVSTSLFAMVIVTLPGMYPLKALRTSRDLILGRRIKLLLRVVWMALFLLAVWLVVLIPVILLDGWLRSVWPAIEAFPLVPIVILVLSTLSIFWCAAYVYLLYRKVVDYESA